MNPQVDYKSRVDVHHTQNTNCHSSARDFVFEIEIVVARPPKLIYSMQIGPVESSLAQLVYRSNREASRLETWSRHSSNAETI